MKKIILLALMVLFSIDAYSQGKPINKDDVFVPRRVSSGNGLDSLMTSIVAGISTADTSASIQLAGWNWSHLIIKQATGTTGGLIVKALGSTDGVNYSTNLITMDSINWTAATAMKSFDLTAKYGGFHSIRLVIVGSTGPAFAGANKYSVQIRRKP